MSIASGSTLARKSIADVTQRKGRTLVVVLSIFLGVLGLTGINVFSFKLLDAFAHKQDRSHYPDIIVSADRVDPALTAQISALPNVQAVQTQMAERFQWQAASGPLAMNITAFPDAQHVALGRFELTSGYYPGPGEIVLEMTDAALQPFSLNETIQVRGPKGTTSLRIVGIVQTSGLPPVRATRVVQGYMSMRDLSQLLGITTVNSIAIKVRDISMIGDTSHAVSDILQKQHTGIQNMDVASSIAADFGLDFINGFFNVVRVLAFGAIIVSCFLIINTLTTLIAEQMKIIGTMKALGGTQSTIIKGYLLTVLIYSSLGTFLGLALGIAIGYTGVWQFAKMKLLYLGAFSIPPNVFLIAIGCGMAIPLLAALLTLCDGTRITVREALSAYGISSASSSSGRWQRLVAGRLLWVPQTVWLGLRGTFRKRSHALMTILALALSGITFLAVTTFTYSISYLLTQLRVNYSYDVYVSIDKGALATPPPFAQLRQLVGGLPNVSLVEPGNSAAVRTQWGFFDIEGLDAATQVYRKPIVAGRWFAPGEHDVLLLDEQTLHQSHLSIGDMFPLTDDKGHKAAWKIIGVVNDKSPTVGFSGVAITSIENVNRLVGDPENSARLLYIQAHDHSPAALKQLSNQIDQKLQQIGNTAPAMTKQQQLDADEYSALSICIIFYAAAAGVAMVGILGLYNTLMSSVLERQREIGIWRSMGASNWQVSRVFWIEGLSLAGLAWLVGAIIGVPVAYGFVLLVSRWLFPVPFAFDPRSLPLMLLALVVIATLACFGPTARASRARIAGILRYE